MRPHPIAEIFPDIDGVEFEALVEDIRDYGACAGLSRTGDDCARTFK